MDRCTAKGLTLRDIRRITRRDQAESEAIRKAVEEILANVEQGGDAAVRAYTKQFDGVDIDDFLVTPEEIEKGCRRRRSGFYEHP